MQPYQKRLLDMLACAELSEKKVIKVGCVGVHPQNREGTGLTVSDVHNLLQVFTSQGFLPEMVDALAAQIPPTEEGEAWRCWNEKLARDSDGLLAPVVGSDLEYVTARGSHTTAAVRCYARPEPVVRGMHKEMCDEDGMISQSKVFELKPSARLALEGITYTVVRHEIITAVPRLMAVLSRTGNAGHGTHRVQTCAQSLKRAHDLVCDHASSAEDEIVKMMSSGMPAGYEEHARSCIAFAMRWGGGRDGALIAELTTFEKTISNKRLVATKELMQLARMDLLEHPLVVMAVVKSSICAPANMCSHGYSSMFNAADFVTAGSKLMKIVGASALMAKAREFAGAYAQLTDAESNQRLSSLDVNIVMLTFAKKSDLRKTYPTLYAIADEFYMQLKTQQAAIGKQLPAWGYLEQLAKSQQGHASRDMRTKVKDTSEKLQNVGALTIAVQADGSVSAATLANRGFVLEALVHLRADVEKSSDTVSVYKISGLPDDGGAELTRVYTVEKQSGDHVAEGQPDPVTVIARGVLMNRYVLHEEAKREVTCCIGKRTHSSKLHAHSL